MRLLYQFGVILFITFLGEMLHFAVPLPVPASIYGLVLMLLALVTKVIKLEQVKIAGDFLITIMPPMFIPAAVGLLVVWPKLQEVLFPILVITVVSTIIVMVVTGKTVQGMIKAGRDKECGKDERISE